MLDVELQRGQEKQPGVGGMYKRFLRCHGAYRAIPGVITPSRKVVRAPAIAHGLVCVNRADFQIRFGAYRMREKRPRAAGHHRQQRGARECFPDSGSAHQCPCITLNSGGSIAAGNGVYLIRRPSTSATDSVPATASRRISACATTSRTGRGPDAPPQRAHQGESLSEPRPTTRAARSSSRVRGSAAASDTDIEQKVSTKEETANKAKGGKTGVLFQIHFFTDDLFSKIIGKPTFGG